MSQLQTPCEIKDPGYTEIRHTPVGAVTKGSVVVVGDDVLVAIADVGAGKEGAFAVRASKAVIAKAAPLVIAEGDKLYWSDANQTASKTDTDVACGYAAKAALSADTTVEIILDGLN